MAIDPDPLRSTHPPGETMEALVEGAPQAMLVTDAGGRILRANARAGALLERGVEEIVGLSLPDIVLARDRLPLGDSIRESLERGIGSPDMEATIIHPHGMGGLVALTFLPFASRHGPRMLLLLRDLTLERRARDAAGAAERAAERAEAADLRKLADLGRVTSGVVHEVKTPLTYVNNNIAIQLQLIDAMMEARPEMREQLTMLREVTLSAKQGADRMTRLLLDLRPLAQNRAQRREPADLAMLVTDAVKIFRGTHRGATAITLDLESTHPVLVDRDEICQVLLNLFNNAAAAMDDGGEIHVSTRNRDQPPQIRVRDAGPGVPPEARGSLFQPFRTSKKEGTGLGLFISRRIIESHGGTLTYEPPAEGGACFVIRLPRS